MSSFLQSGGNTFEGFEGFATLEGLEKLEQLVRFHDFPTPFGRKATATLPEGVVAPTSAPEEAPPPKQFQVLDLKISSDFFGVDNLFAEEKYKKLLDDLSANLCLLDETGRIVYTNNAWQTFSCVNGGTSNTTDVGVNYLELCRTCTGDFVDNAQFFAEGLSRSISGRTIGEFCFEYPCDSATLARWCTAKVFTFHLGTKKITVVAHEQQSELPKPTASTSAKVVKNSNSTMNASGVGKRPLVVVDPLPTEDLLAQLPPDSPTTTSQSKRRKLKQPSLPRKLVFLSQGGPPEAIPSCDKAEIQQEIHFAETYLALLRTKLSNLTASSTT